MTIYKRLTQDYTTPKPRSRLLSDVSIFVLITGIVGGSYYLGQGNFDETIAQGLGKLESIFKGYDHLDPDQVNQWIDNKSGKIIERLEPYESVSKTKTDAEPQNLARLYFKNREQKLRACEALTEVAEVVMRKRDDGHDASELKTVIMLTDDKKVRIASNWVVDAVFETNLSWLEFKPVFELTCFTTINSVVQ